MVCHISNQCELCFCSSPVLALLDSPSWLKSDYFYTYFTLVYYRALLGRLDYHIILVFECVTSPVSVYYDYKES